MTTEELKKNIDLMYSNADLIDSSPMGSVFHKAGLQGALRNALKRDLISFVLYLIGTNGSVSSRDVRFFNYLLDFSADLHEIQKIINTNLDIVEYENHYPETFSMYVACDKHLPKMGMDTNGRFSALYLMLLIDIAETFVGYYDTSEAKPASLRFLKKLEKYRSERLSDVLTQEDQSNEPANETKKSEDKPKDSETLNDLLKQLDDLVGMERVKQDVHSLINLMRIREIKKQRGLPQNDLSLHMVFMGNPGTGKTTVARLIAKIYQKLGVLSKGHLVEVDRSGLVAGYVGQTALKVQEKITESRGGVLFIDEAYALTANRDSSDFGFEAVDTLLKGMEDYRDDFVVIVAGYPDPMAEFLESNPGLKSRFNKFIYFDDYTPDELLSIFCGMCKKAGFNVSESAMQIVYNYFIRMYENRGTNFANGRDVRNFFEKVVVHQANRLAQYDVLSDDDLVTLNEVDFHNSMSK